MDNYLFIRWNMNNLLSQMVNSENIDYIAAYKGGKSRVLSVIRELWIKLRIPGKKIWYNNQIGNYCGTIIINDAMMTEEFLRWVKERNPDARCILWYWNNITEHVIQPEQVRKIGYELWSYSKKDCEKYQLKYNTQFYSKAYYDNFNLKIKKNITSEVSFVGKDKGRIGMINALEESAGIEVNSYFVADHFYEFYKKKEYHFKALSYKAMLDRYLMSKAILDIVTDVNGGLTLRIMDGLYFEKKVITNNRTVKDYDFYHPNNFFVIGMDDISQIHNFLSTEYQKLNENTKEFYELKKWLERF